MNRKLLEQTLVEGALTLDLKLDNAVVAKLIDYLALVIKWNKTHNLTAITDPNEMVVLHLLDSLSVLAYIEGNRIIDIGTGAGLPGLVLAMADPHREYFLLDSLQKRTSFLKHVCHKLSISNVTVINSRAENYQPEDKFDVIVSRAFSSLAQMVEYTYHLADNGGLFLAMKGVYPHDEIKTLSDNVKLAHVVTCDVPMLEAQRHVVLLRKNKV